MAVYCKRCGYKNIPEGAEECPNCGAPIPKQIKPVAKKKDFKPKSNPNVIPAGAQKPKLPLIIAIVVVLVLGVAGGFFLGNRAGKNEMAADTEVEEVLDNTAAIDETDVTESVQPESEQISTDDIQQESDQTSTAAVQQETEQTGTVIQEFGIGRAIQEEEPESTATERSGTVYIVANATNNRIKVRKTPGLDGKDTGKRKYSGDKVTVYEETSKDGYTWYRIGKDQWMADNGKSFGVKFN